jgi:hypothetical protein
VGVVRCLAADPGLSIQPIGASWSWRDHPTRDRLELQDGDEAVAVFKSSSVMPGVKA